MVATPLTTTAPAPQGANDGLVSGGLERFAELAAERKSPEFQATWREGADLFKTKVVPGALGSFRDGLQSLPQAVRRALGEDKVCTGMTLSRVEAVEESPFRYRATFATKEGATKQVLCKSLALTIPSHAYGSILEGLEGSEEVVTALASVRYGRPLRAHVRERSARRWDARPDASRPCTAQVSARGERDPGVQDRVAA